MFPVARYIFHSHVIPNELKPSATYPAFALVDFNINIQASKNARQKFYMLNGVRDKLPVG